MLSLFPEITLSEIGEKTWASLMNLHSACPIKQLRFSKFFLMRELNCLTSSNVNAFGKHRGKKRSLQLNNFPSILRNLSENEKDLWLLCRRTCNSYTPKKRKPYAILIRQCIFEFNSPLLVLLDGRAQSQVFWNIVDGIVKTSPNN